MLDRTYNEPCKVLFLAKFTLIKHATVVLDQRMQLLKDQRVETFAIFNEERSLFCDEWT